MAKRKLYQVRDGVADCFVGPVILERDDAPAVRAFYAALEDPKSSLGQFPKDFELWCLGAHDDVTGLTAMESSVVARGVEWVHMKEREDAQVS